MSTDPARRAARPARFLLALAATLIGAAVAGPAHAERFGGFSADGSRFLVGADRVCELPVGTAAPRCARRPAGELAAHGFARGSEERGKAARLRARPSGSKIEVTDEAGQPLASWDAGSVVSAVSAVFRSKDGRRVALEYAIRLGGRERTEVIALALAIPAAAPGAGVAAAPAVPEPTLSKDERAALDQAITRAEAELGRKRWARAEAQARAALAVDPAAPRARYALAVARRRLGKPAEAIALLVELGRSGRVGVPELLVEARSAEHFAAQRVEPGFRKAVGLDPDPGRPLSGYERLLGPGGRWEQSAVPCKDPEVGLALDRKKRRFTLSIRLRCQGDDDETRLGGRFEVAEPAELTLVFPNPGEADERMACELAACGDGSGEDCLRCALDDLGFTLRVVRR